MSTEATTHYTALGLAPTAPQSVIRAAYKALVQTHHPENTVHLSHELRASHAAVFRTIQEAYDVLSNASSKAAYDAELERHGNRIHEKRSIFQRTPSSQGSTPTTPKRSNSIRVTSPEEKRAMKAKVEQDIAYLREQACKRDAEDARMDVAGLRFMLKTWKEMTEVHANDAFMRSHCAIHMRVYQSKIEMREKEHEEWLDSMSKPKVFPNNVLKCSRSTTPSSPALPRPNQTVVQTPTTSTTGQRVDARERNDTKRAEHADRMEARLAEKARKDAAKQAHLDMKAAAVRAEKEKLKQRAEANAKRDAERIAKARAKAGAAPKGTVGAEMPTNEGYSGPSIVRGVMEADGHNQVSGGKPCGNCGAKHTSFAEWRKCNMGSGTQKSGDEKEVSFFSDV